MTHENSVGSMQCNCGETMDVRQSKKRGHYLYTCCPSCGLDQRTGAPVQNWIYHNAIFTGEVLKPSNVVDDWQPKPSEPVSEQPSEVVSEPVSEVLSESSLDLTEADITPEATESVALEQKPERTLSARRLFGCVLVLVGFVGAVWQTV